MFRFFGLILLYLYKYDAAKPRNAFAKATEERRNKEYDDAIFTCTETDERKDIKKQKVNRQADADADVDADAKRKVDEKENLKHDYIQIHTQPIYVPSLLP